MDANEWLTVSQEDCILVPVKDGYCRTNVILVRRGDMKPVEQPSQELKDALNSIGKLLPKATGKWGEF